MIPEVFHMLQVTSGFFLSLWIHHRLRTGRSYASELFDTRCAFFSAGLDVEGLSTG